MKGHQLNCYHTIIEVLFSTTGLSVTLFMITLLYIHMQYVHSKDWQVYRSPPLEVNLNNSLSKCTECHCRQCNVHSIQFQCTLYLYSVDAPLVRPLKNVNNNMNIAQGHFASVCRVLSGCSDGSSFVRMSDLCRHVDCHNDNVFKFMCDCNQQSIRNTIHTVL